jgi:O-acetyl-ADP-ribose deacetylase (regulator of RNase III)
LKFNPTISLKGVASTYPDVVAARGKDNTEYCKLAEAATWCKTVEELEDQIHFYDPEERFIARGPYP